MANKAYFLIQSRWKNDDDEFDSFVEVTLQRSQSETVEPNVKGRLAGVLEQIIAKYSLMLHSEQSYQLDPNLVERVLELEPGNTIFVGSEVDPNHGNDVPLWPVNISITRVAATSFFQV